MLYQYDYFLYVGKLKEYKVYTRCSVVLILYS